MEVSPQLENGYTKIANELIEALARIRIPGEAMQVLLFIIRKTYGWCKKEDVIPLSQFVTGTGMKKPTICRALKKLQSMNIIVIKKDNTIIKKDNDISTIYCFNKTYNSWIPLSKKITNIIKKDKEPLSKKIHSKDILSKETKYSCSEVETTLPSESIFVTFPLIDKTEYPITDTLVNEMQELFPGVNVQQAFRSMKAWLISTPEKRKTKRGIRRFYTGWLERDQNSGKNPRIQSPPVVEDDIPDDIRFPNRSDDWYKPAGKT